jgi:oxygen-independent coproporphyrinogen-3 oxidase
MAGIYIHIPFCKKACHYCDFHFSTSLNYTSELLAAMLEELDLRKDYLGGDTVNTIYFGGGTPSLLVGAEINSFLEAIAQKFNLATDAEITLEANPDDLNSAKLKDLSQSPINRFSIGIQSFFDEDLAWMNRSHNAAEAESSIKRIQDAGFENITCDLIYGFPLLSDEKWLHNIAQMLSMEVVHLSCYSMTVEKGTALHSFVQKGKQKPMNDSQSAAQFGMLMDRLAAAGYEHYEISNFALPGKISRHNSNYWKGEKYLGIGPSAHSFDGNSRQWNIANNMKYLAGLMNKQVPAEREELSLNNRFNEYLMTALRTNWGISWAKVVADFGAVYERELRLKITPFEEKNWLINEPERVSLSREGKLFADHIAAELFIVDHE